MTLFSGSAAVAESSNPAEFVTEYYQAKAVAKSPLDTTRFLSARVRSKQKQPPKGMDAAVEMMMMKAMSEGEVKKARIAKSNITATKAVFELTAVEIPQQYKDMAKGAASSSLKGNLVLVKEGTGWKVDKDMWTFTSVNKNGKMSESSGIAGPEDDSSKSSAATSSTLAPPTDFEGQVREKMMQSWKGTGTGKSIYAVITVAADGKITGLKVRGEKPQPAAEKQVIDAFTSAAPFQPIPAAFQTKRNIWMAFDWSENGKSVSGPYFSEEPHPDWLLQKVGLK